jgi:hypothetical protein
MGVYGFDGQPEEYSPPREMTEQEYYDPLPDDAMTQYHWSNQYGNSDFRYTRTGRGYADDPRNISEQVSTRVRSVRYPSPGRGYVPFGAYSEDREKSMSPPIIPKYRKD